MGKVTLSCFKRHCCLLTAIQIAEKHLDRAQQLISTEEVEDVEAALRPIEAALELVPGYERAMELKARALLFLRKFKDVLQMLYEHVPSLPSAAAAHPFGNKHDTAGSGGAPDSPVAKEKTRLLSEYFPDTDQDHTMALKRCFPIPAGVLRRRKSKKKPIRQQQQWRYLVLGEACWHLGMLEDAMILLQSGKRNASAVSRRRSNSLREDNFCSEIAGLCRTSASISAIGPTTRRNSSAASAAVAAAQSEMVAQMLSNIKFLLRRRTAALAALEAGAYAESARHFTKIIDGRKGTPQGFISDCYLHRAIAYQALGRVVDAIADCNRSLALNPQCTKALSVRASLYEMVRCYSECLLDLQQLKMIYEASLRYKNMGAMAWITRQLLHYNDTDFVGGLEYINSKIMAARQRLSAGGAALDAHTILDMPRNCSREDVKRAYLLLSLKHRPDKAVQFIERCELVDQMEKIENVREAAKASATRLSQLIHKAYVKLLAAIAAEEEEEQRPVSPLPLLRGASSYATPLPLPAATATPVPESEPLISFSDDERDGCDFCQPFGGFSTAALATALSQVLCSDLSLPSTWPADSATAWQNPDSSTWTPDWTMPQSQPIYIQH